MKKLYPTQILLLTFIFLLLGFLQMRAQLPNDFQRVELSTGLANATTMTFAPDGRIFLLDRYGEVLIYHTDTQTRVSAGSLSVFHEIEDGLLGIAFDPDFLINNYIYLHYSPLSESVNRVSRFTMNGDLLDISSEIVLLDWPTQRLTCCHSGGDMGFDSQGNLYIATGDNSQHSDYAPLFENNIYWSAEKSSSNMNDLRGKILRITPQANGTYTIPAGNLFPGGAGGLPEIYVMGARNPYRIFIDKENTDWLFWGEVGPDANTPDSKIGPEGLDEMNLTKTAGNYGWPYFSGVDNDAYKIDYAPTPYFNDPATPKNISTWNTGGENLPPAVPSWLEFFHESHFAGPRYYHDATLTDQQRMPIEFDGMFFYYDFNDSKIWVVEMDANGDILSNEQLAPDVFDESKDGFIDMEFGPDGHMYLLQYGAGCCPDNVGTGKLVRVDYTGVVTNSSPVVVATADVTNGSLPLTVNFSSDGTIDPDGDTPLVYEWDFQSDSTVDSNDENPTFTYTTAGTFQAQLRVSDGNGGIGVKNITINAGNNAATFNFNSPPDGGFVGWGDDIDLGLEVTDIEDGSTSNSGINCNDVNVVPSLGHLNHFHDDLTLTGCPQTATLAYDGHDIYGEMDIFYVLGTNYTDAGGLTSFDQIRLHPKRKEAEFYDAQNGTEIIDNTDIVEGGTSSVRVDHGGYIVFEGRNLFNITGVKYRVSSASLGGNIELRIGSPTGTLVANTAVPVTGGANIWSDVESTFMDPGGKNDLYFVFNGNPGQQDIFDLNYVEFIGVGASVDNSPPKVNEVGSNSTTEVQIEFSEYVTEVTSEQTSNYSIDNGVSVSSAALQPDKRTVLLTVSPLAAGTVYNLTISNVENEVGLPIVTATYTLGTINPNRINSGGPQVTVSGLVFDQDQYATGGNNFIRSIPIAGTADDELYTSERFGNMAYEIPVETSGEYDVRLHFAELFHGVGSTPGGAGSRIFNVDIEGNQLLTSFDIAAEVGSATALFKEFNDVNVTDGFLTITFSSIVGDPKISAIEVLDSGTFNAIPKISIVSPSNGWEVNQPFDVSFAISNWAIGQGNTHVHYYIDDMMVGPYYSYDPITIEDLSLGEHTIKIELFNPDHTGTGVFDEVTVNVSDQISCNETPFPESWVVHEFDENPYVAVYTFAENDLDGDGLKDIVTGGWWYKNPGSAAGDWQKSDVGTGFGNVAHVRDFDGDGDMDLLGTTLGNPPDVYESVQLVWAQNDGMGNFTIFNNIPAGDSNYTEPFVAGLAGGVFSINGPYQMAINWNGGESTGSPVQMLTPTADPTSGTWSLVNISDDSSGEDIQAGDIDGDGDLDLFQGINWLRNNGNINNWETFLTGISYPTTVDRAQLADFDRDGDLDAVVGQLGASNSLEFSWFAAPDDPTQLWTRNILSTNVRGSLSVFAIDIDFDGDQDIVVGEWRGGRRLLAFENDLCGSGTFIPKTIDDGSSLLEHHDGARVVDIDNDGDLDVVSNGWRNQLIPRIFENTTLRPADDRPLASAGPDQNVTLPSASIVLNGSGSDPDGGDVTFQWTQLSGPDTITLSGETTASLTLTVLSEGTYAFELSVTDNEGDTTSDEVIVNVGDSPSFPLHINSGGPSFNFNGEQWIADQFFLGGANFEEVLDIANTENDALYQTERFTTNDQMTYEIPVINGSYDIDLHFAEIYFGVVGGDGEAGGIGSRVFNVDIENGQYQLNNYDIIVAAGGSATAVVESFAGIMVSDGNLTIILSEVTQNPKISGIEVSVSGVGPGTPIVDAGGNQSITLPTNSTILNGSGSDPDGGEVIFLWTQSSGPNTATLTGSDGTDLTLSDMIQGEYVFRLTVTDDEGEMSFDEVAVTVIPEGGNLPPVAVASAAPSTGIAPLEVNFTGSNSTDDIGVETYLWDFKDGNTSTDANPTHTFITTGTYEVELTVTDVGGMTDSTSITITVGEQMGVILEKNPSEDGIATIIVLNQPVDFMMLGINLHDVQGRLLGSFRPDEVLVDSDTSSDTYEIPLYTLRDGLYFVNIAMNQGKPVTLKLLVKN